MVGESYDVTFFIGHAITLLQYTVPYIVLRAVHPAKCSSSAHPCPLPFGHSKQQQKVAFVRRGRAIHLRLDAA